jgi:hypothetical protein
MLPVAGAGAAGKRRKPRPKKVSPPRVVSPPWLERFADAFLALASQVSDLKEQVAKLVAAASSTGAGASSGPEKASPPIVEVGNNVHSNPVVANELQVPTCDTVSGLSQLRDSTALFAVSGSGSGEDSLPDSSVPRIESNESLSPLSLDQGGALTLRGNNTEVSFPVSDWSVLLLLRPKVWMMALRLALISFRRERVGSLLSADDPSKAVGFPLRIQEVLYLSSLKGHFTAEISALEDFLGIRLTPPSSAPNWLLNTWPDRKLLRQAYTREYIPTFRRTFIYTYETVEIFAPNPYAHCVCGNFQYITHISQGNYPLQVLPRSRFCKVFSKDFDGYTVYKCWIHTGHVISAEAPTRMVTKKFLTYPEEEARSLFFLNCPHLLPKGVSEQPWMKRYRLLGDLKDRLTPDLAFHFLTICLKDECEVCDIILTLLLKCRPLSTLSLAPPLAPVLIPGLSMSRELLKAKEVAARLGPHRQSAQYVGFLSQYCGDAYARQFLNVSVISHLKSVEVNHDSLADPYSAVAGLQVYTRSFFRSQLPIRLLSLTTGLILAAPYLLLRGLADNLACQEGFFAAMVALRHVQMTNEAVIREDVQLANYRQALLQEQERLASGEPMSVRDFLASKGKSFEKLVDRYKIDEDGLCNSCDMDCRECGCY